MRRAAKASIGLAAALAALLLTLWPAPRGAAGDPPRLSGSLTSLSVTSPALGRAERTLVYLPPGYDGGSRRYPLVILLHGVPGQPEDFVRQGLVSRIDALVHRRTIPPVIVAMPVGGDRPADDNEWADSTRSSSERWETFVAHDLVLALDRRFRLIPARAARAIAGVSMGGFGAVNIALHHRSEFAAVGSWSGYFSSNTPSVHAPGSAGWVRDSPQRYVGAMRPSLAAWHPAISFYVGALDRFRAENVRLAATLSRLGVEHRFRVVPGAGHTWTLWAAQVDAEMSFLVRSLTPAASPPRASPRGRS